MIPNAWSVCPSPFASESLLNVKPEISCYIQILTFAFRYYIFHSMSLICEQNFFNWLQNTAILLAMNYFQGYECTWWGRHHSKCRIGNFDKAFDILLRKNKTNWWRSLRRQASSCQTFWNHLHFVMESPKFTTGCHHLIQLFPCDCRDLTAAVLVCNDKQNQEIILTQAIVTLAAITTKMVVFRTKHPISAILRENTEL